MKTFPGCPSSIASMLQASDFAATSRNLAAQLKQIEEFSADKLEAVRE